MDTKLELLKLPKRLKKKKGKERKIKETIRRKIELIEHPRQRNQKGEQRLIAQWKTIVQQRKQFVFKEKAHCDLQTKKDLSRQSVGFMHNIDSTSRARDAIRILFVLFRVTYNVLWFTTKIKNMISIRIVNYIFIEQTINNKWSL